VRRLARQLGIEMKIEFLGFVYGEALTKRYQEADIFVLPSLSESFSMALLEAMASGLPVVATNVGGTPELVTDGENGFLVPPADPDSLSDAIERLATSSDIRHQFALANRRKTEGPYTWSPIADAYLERYQDASDTVAGRAAEGD
jgi:glycosyltransferase involved in cell wall biosynthesis